MFISYVLRSITEKKPKFSREWRNKVSLYVGYLHVYYKLTGITFVINGIWSNEVTLTVQQPLKEFWSLQFKSHHKAKLRWFIWIPWIYFKINACYLISPICMMSMIYFLQVLQIGNSFTWASFGNKIYLTVATQAKRRSFSCLWKNKFENQNERHNVNSDETSIKWFALEEIQLIVTEIKFIIVLNDINFG